MKLLIENWNKFMNESANDIESSINMIKNYKLKSCFQINNKLTKSFTRKHRLECLAIGTDKYVFSDSEKSGWVLKFEKKDPVKQNSTMEAVVWKYLKTTPFERVLAPIEDHDSFYYMKRSKTPGKYNDLEKALSEIAGEINVDFQELKYYFLADANKENIRIIDGKTVLIDYDDSWDWVFNNKNIIKNLRGDKNVR